MLSLLDAAILLTSSSNGSQYTPTFPGGGLLVAWLICNGAKRSAIGGWLLFFYWQLYGGLLITSIFFAFNIQSYIPENFDNTERYLLFVGSAVPSLLLLLAQVAVGTILLSVRTWDLLKLLRWLLAAEIIAAIGATVIDAAYFPDDVGLNLLTISRGVFWLAFFLRSAPFNHVFLTLDSDGAGISIART